MGWGLGWLIGRSACQMALIAEVGLPFPIQTRAASVSPFYR